MIGYEFVTAGNATFTVRQPASAPGNPHYTFRVRKKEANPPYPEAYFVSLLTGPDNDSAYTYLGVLNPQTGEVRLTKKSAYAEDSYPVRLLRRVLACLLAGKGLAITAAGYDVMHEGKCGRCGRTLTVPESLDNGIGPECIKLMGLVPA